MKARTSDRGSDRDCAPAKPLVWVLQGHRVGDNLQVRALAGALGWPCAVKTLIWQKPLPRWSPLYGRATSLKHLTADAKDLLAAPWPDLVLSIGWRSVPIARWIKDQSGARLVHLGRPRAPLSAFDLVLSTPQYRLPDAPNIVQLNGPLTRAKPQDLTSETTIWARRMAHLPRPWTVVLVGGDTPTLRFPVSMAHALAAQCNAHAARYGGSLLIATSPRTSPEVTAALRGAITAPSAFHVWEKDADSPYEALQTLADAFIVTNDSISMTHEAALTGRPLLLFALSTQHGGAAYALRRLDKKLRTGPSAVARGYLGLIKRGVLYPPKAPEDYFQKLIDAGRAQTLGFAGEIGENPPMPSENERAAEAVQTLLQPPNGGLSGTR